MLSSFFIYLVPARVFFFSRILRSPDGPTSSCRRRRHRRRKKGDDIIAAQLKMIPLILLLVQTHYSSVLALLP